MGGTNENGKVASPGKVPICHENEKKKVKTILKVLKHDGNIIGMLSYNDIWYKTCMYICKLNVHRRKNI